MQKPRGFILRHAIDGHARPARDDLRDLFLADGLFRLVHIGLPGLLQVFHFGAQGALLIAQRGGLFKRLRAHSLILLLRHGGDLPLQRLHIRRRREGVNPHA